MLIRSSSHTLEPGTVLRSGETAFALLKQEVDVDRRTVFLQENTLVFVLQGYKHLHFDNHSFVVEPERLLFMKRGLYVMSEFIPEGLSYEALVMFSTNSFLKAFSLKYMATDTVPAAGPESPYLLLPVDHLLASFRDQYLSYFKAPMANQDALLQLKLEELFLLLISGGHGTAVRTWIQSVVQGQPLDIEYVMRTYLFQPLTLSELAGLSGRSLASFKRDFQERFSGSPGKWIHHQRLLHAQMLLHNTGQSVSEVAAASGFESTSYFIRAFKQAFGDTPQVWRAK